MPLCRFEHPTDGRPRIGRRDGGSIVDLTPAVDSFADAVTRLGRGDLPDGGEPMAKEVALLPPVTPANTVFAIALNYGSHIEEKSTSDAVDSASRSVPETPYFFVKLHRALVGDGRPIRFDRDVTAGLDYAAELAAVIGRPASDVTAAEAGEYVAGYTVLNDTTAYDIQNVAVGDMTWIDWVSAKSLESTTPIGPHIVPADSVEEPDDLAIVSRVNGETMQDGSTAAMIRTVEEQVAFLSTRVTLRPGDVIATGTPEGVGAFQELTLEDGDRIDIEVEGVGRLSNTVRATAP